MVFPDAVGKQLCVVSISGRSSGGHLPHGGDEQPSPARAGRAQRDSGDRAILTHGQGNGLCSSTALSCAGPGAPRCTETQHMCRVINSYRLTPEIKRAGTELENVSAKKQQAGSNKG